MRGCGEVCGVGLLACRADGSAATTVLLVGVGLLVWGVVSTVDRLRRIRTFVAGFAGAIASIGTTVAITISANPLWSLAYLAAVPVSAAAGLAAGVLLGTAAETRRVRRCGAGPDLRQRNRGAGRRGCRHRSTMLRYRPNTDEPVRSRPSKAIMALCTVAGTLTGGSAFWPEAASALAIGVLSAAGSVTLLRNPLPELHTDGDVIVYLRRTTLAIIVNFVCGVGFATAGFVIAWTVAHLLIDII